jgi:hypothetical protein
MKVSSRLVSSFALAAALAVTALSGAPADAAQCTTGGAVGAGNAAAYNAGFYDGQCGQYVWFGYGYNYNGFCANAAANAHAAGIGTVATGTCATGTVYNYYAGGYHAQCRFGEYYGHGFNQNSTCSIAMQYVSAGQCTGCQ